MSDSIDVRCYPGNKRSFQKARWLQGEPYLCYRSVAMPLWNKELLPPLTLGADKVALGPNSAMPLWISDQFLVKNDGYGFKTVVLGQQRGGGSTAVKHKPHDREFVGLNTVGSRAFSLLYPLIQVLHGGARLLIFLLKKICLAAQLLANQAQ